MYKAASCPEPGACSQCCNSTTDSVDLFPFPPFAKVVVVVAAHRGQGPQLLVPEVPVVVLRAGLAGSTTTAAAEILVPKPSCIPRPRFSHVASIFWRVCMPPCFPKGIRGTDWWIVSMAPVFHLPFLHTAPRTVQEASLLPSFKGPSLESQRSPGTNRAIVLPVIDPRQLFVQ